MHFKQDDGVKEKFHTYPNHIREKMASLRKLVIETASGLKDVRILEKTLKW